jgi:predicted RNase H-like nuclease (RuvC/YqgF family)
MLENVNQEDNPEKEPTLVPPLPKWELERLIRVELKIENLSEGYRELKQDIKNNTKAIDRLGLVVDALRKNMDEKFADQRKYTDEKFAAVEKCFEKQSQVFKNMKNWVVGSIVACSCGILILLIRSGFGF